MWLQSQIVKQLNRIIDDNLEYFLSFDNIKVYYDVGQKEILTILNSVFTTRFSNVIFKDKEIQSYRLAQVADLICTLELLHNKQIDGSFSKSDNYFFGSMNRFNNNYYKTIIKKKSYNIQLFYRKERTNLKDRTKRTTISSNTNETTIAS